MSPAFQEQFRQAVSTMLVLPEYREVFTRFFIAHEYRRQFLWLEEHQPQRKGQSGLAVALQTALATYIVPGHIPSEISATPLASASDQSEYQPDKLAMDPHWADKFMLAVVATIEEKLSLERFAQRLARATVNVASNGPGVLQKHIAGALDNYYAQRETGLSPDPF